jgi:hypothetical protein
MKKYYDLARKITFGDFTDTEVQECFDKGTLEIKDNKIYCYTCIFNTSIDINTEEIKQEIVNEKEFIKRMQKDCNEIDNSDLQGITETYIMLTNRNVDFMTQFKLSDELLKKIKGDL